MLSVPKKLRPYRVASTPGDILIILSWYQGCPTERWNLDTQKSYHFISVYINVCYIEIYL